MQIRMFEHIVLDVNDRHVTQALKAKIYNDPERVARLRVVVVDSINMLANNENTKEFVVGIHNDNGKLRNLVTGICDLAIKYDGIEDIYSVIVEEYHKNNHQEGGKGGRPWHA